MPHTNTGLTVLILAFWGALCLVISPDASAKTLVNCQGQVCYDCTQHSRLMGRISELISCKLKLKKRDAALANISGLVTLWKSRDDASQLRIKALTKERDQARAKKELAAQQIRKAWTVFWSVTGSLVVVSVVVITVMAVTRPAPVTNTAPLIYIGRTHEF